MDISMWKNMSFPFKHYLFSPYKIPEKRENIRVFRGLAFTLITTFSIFPDFSAVINEKPEKHERFHVLRV